MANQRKKDEKKSFSTKRCWNCNTHMKVNETKCPACHHKVGPANDHGVGKKPLEWKNYFLAIVAIGILCTFIWWSFLRGS